MIIERNVKSKLGNSGSNRSGAEFYNSVKPGLFSDFYGTIDVSNALRIGTQNDGQQAGTIETYPGETSMGTSTNVPIPDAADNEREETSIRIVNHLSQVALETSIGRLNKALDNTTDAETAVLEDDTGSDASYGRHCS